MELFQWINNQCLKMTWLDQLVQQFVQQVIGIDTATRLGGSIHFFIYDVIKIFILLTVLIFLVTYIQSFFPPEKTKKLIGEFHGIKANIIGALLGTVTPFCSCSSIPLFIGFTKAGLPIGVTFSFLISSPLVDLASVLMLASFFNWKIALMYVLVGLVLAVIGGSLISFFHMERYIQDFVLQQIDSGNGSILPDYIPSVRDRLKMALDGVLDIIRKVWLYIFVGVFIGALIHNWIPPNVTTLLLGSEHWYSVLLATFVGIPMYADIFGALPIAEALVTKGISIGTALSFMMAVTALSLPSLILLKNVVKTRLLIFFTGIVTVGILIIGYFFNLFGYLFV